MVILKENDKFLPSSDFSQRSRKNSSNIINLTGTFDLTCKWKEMRNSEKMFKQCSGSKTYINITYTPNTTTNNMKFNKLLRKTERSYYRKLSTELNEANSKNPKQFWDYINKLGPRKNSKIPERVYIQSNSGPTTDNMNDVLNTWENDFSELYNFNNETSHNFDNTFLIRNNSRKHTL